MLLWLENFDVVQISWFFKSNCCHTTTCFIFVFICFFPPISFCFIFSFERVKLDGRMPHHPVKISTTQKNLFDWSINTFDIFCLAQQCEKPVFRVEKIFLTIACTVNHAIFKFLRINTLNLSLIVASMKVLKKFSLKCRGLSNN